MLVVGFEHRPAFGIPYNLPYYPAWSRRRASNQRRNRLRLPGRRIAFPKGCTRWPGASAAPRAARGALSFAAGPAGTRAAAAIFVQLGLGGDDRQRAAHRRRSAHDGEQLLWFADPRLIKIVMKDEQPVGFLFAYPDISAAVQRTRGRRVAVGLARPAGRTASDEVDQHQRRGHYREVPRPGRDGDSCSVRCTRASSKGVSRTPISSRSGGQLGDAARVARPGH